MECEYCGHPAEDHVEDILGDVHCEGDGWDEEEEWVCDCTVYEEKEEE